MPTYQEQIAQRKAERAMIAFVELGTLGRALAILERDKIIDAEARICFLKAYILEHPDINEMLAEQKVKLTKPV